MTRLASRLFALLAAVVALLFAGPAFAASLVLSPSGPLELDEAGKGTFVVRNQGSANVHVTAVYARTTERDPRIPGTLTASFDGAQKVDLAPGASRTVTVKWDRHGARAAQLFGHVVVESTDPAAPQIALGVVAQPPSALPIVSRHLLSLAVLVPALGALLLALLSATRRADARIVRGVALIAAGVPCAIAVRALREFEPLFARDGGNDGYQLVERAHLFGPVELWLGIDGVSLPFLLLSTVVAFVVVVAAHRVERRYEAHLAFLLLLASATTGAFVAVDGMLFLIALAVAGVAAAGAVATGSGDLRHVAAVKLAIAFGVAVALVAVVMVALRKVSGPTFLLDGTRTASFAFPELARTDFVERSATAHLAGLPLVEGALVLSFVGFATLLALPPFHGWLVDVVVEAPGAVSAFVVAVVTKLGAYGLLRLDALGLAPGMRWAAPALAAIAVVAIVHGAFSAYFERDVARVAARLSVAHAGLVLLGAAALTPSGASGAIVASFAHGLASAALLVVVGSVVARLGTREMERIGGLFAEAPRAASIALVAFAALAFAPLSVGFVGALLGVLGAFPVHVVAAAVAALGLAVTGASVARAAGKMLFGAFDPSWRKSGRLEPFGGRLPDLDGRELAALAVLALLIVLYGVAPSSLVAMTAAAVDTITP